jgi:hypothetical protein
MTEEEMKTLEDIIAHHLRVFKEDLCRKFDLLIEGQQMLAAKVDRAAGIWVKDEDR